MADRSDRERRGGQPGDYEDMFRQIMEFLSKRSVSGDEHTGTTPTSEYISEEDDPFWIDFEQIYANYEQYEAQMGAPGLARSRARGILRRLNLNPDDEEAIRKLAIFAAMHVLEGRETANEPQPSVIDIDTIHVYNPAIHSADRQQNGDFELKLDDGAVRLTLNLHHCIDVRDLIELVSDIEPALAKRTNGERPARSRSPVRFGFYFTSHGVELYRDPNGAKQSDALVFLPAGEESVPAVVCHLDQHSANDLVSRLKKATK